MLNWDLLRKTQKAFDLVSIRCDEIQGVQNDIFTPFLNLDLYSRDKRIGCVFVVVILEPNKLQFRLHVWNNYESNRKK